MQYYQIRNLKENDIRTVRMKVEAALKKEGFGILTEIDIQSVMKQKLNKQYLPHVILGACNPSYADKVLTLDPRISTLLPCNVTIRQLESGETEVAVMDPSAVMSIVGNTELETYANEVREKLSSVLDSL